MTIEKQLLFLSSEYIYRAITFLYLFTLCAQFVL